MHTGTPPLTHDTHTHSAHTCTHVSHNAHMCTCMSSKHTKCTQQHTVYAYTQHIHALQCVYMGTCMHTQDTCPQGVYKCMHMSPQCTHMLTPMHTCRMHTLVYIHAKCHRHTLLHVHIEHIHICTQTHMTHTHTHAPRTHNM